MNYDILTVEPMSDDELKHSEQAVRQFWARVYRLMNDTGCDIATAIKAIKHADKEQSR